MNKSFLVFDAYNCDTKPNTHALGMKSITVCDASTFFYKSTDHSWSDAQAEENKVRQFARDNATSQLLMIDLERWPIDQLHVNKIVDERCIEINKQKYAEVARWIHNECPGIRLGYYGRLPSRNWWDLVNYGHAVDDIANGKIDSWYAKQMHSFYDTFICWLKSNFNKTLERTNSWSISGGGLASEVDCVFPSLFTFYRSPSLPPVFNDPRIWEWKLYYAKYMIQIARTYHKAVYPCICPYYYLGGSFHEIRMIEEEFWRMQLDTLYDLADGVVIFAKEQYVINDFDESWGWWRATQAFMEEKKLLCMES